MGKKIFIYIPRSYNQTTALLQLEIMSTSDSQNITNDSGRRRAAMPKNNNLKSLLRFHSSKAADSLEKHAAWWPGLSNEESRQQLRERMKAYLEEPNRRMNQSILNPKLCPFCRVFFDEVCDFVPQSRSYARLVWQNLIPQD